MDYVAEPNSSSNGNLPVNNNNPQLEVRNFLSSNMAENDEISSPSSSTPMIESDTATLMDSNGKKEASGSEQRLSKKRSNLDEDSSNCPICFDSSTNSDEHQLCSLKCGHIFGKSCLLRWLSLNKKKSCPICKTKACNSDIRCIHAKELMALDVSELEEIKGKIDKVTQEKNRMQLELTKAAYKEHLLLQEMENLKQKVDSLLRQ